MSKSILESMYSFNFPSNPTTSNDDTIHAFQRILRCIIKSFSHLHFITCRFGSDGFETWNKMFNTALDMLTKLDTLTAQKNENGIESPLISLASELFYEHDRVKG